MSMAAASSQWCLRRCATIRLRVLGRMPQPPQMCNHTVAMSTSVRREVVLPVSPEELWPALTEAERLADWFAPDVDIDARPGGGAVFRWEDATRRAVIEE